MQEKNIEKQMKEELSRFTIETVKEITDNLINYKNTKNLSWSKVYNNVLKKLNLEKEIENNMLKIYVIREISTRGYDLNTNPFSLEKYK